MFLFTISRTRESSDTCRPHKFIARGYEVQKRHTKTANNNVDTLLKKCRNIVACHRKLFSHVKENRYSRLKYSDTFLFPKLKNIETPKTKNCPLSPRSLTMNSRSKNVKFEAENVEIKTDGSESHCEGMSGANLCRRFWVIANKSLGHYPSSGLWNGKVWEGRRGVTSTVLKRALQYVQ